MQRVVRTTLVGLLTIAGLTACGDKVTVPAATTTPVGTVVHQVTVSPPSATLNVGDKITLAASVNADAGVTNRTVTWSSSNTAIATVDANGVVTAVAAGNATIIAKSAADPSVQGAAAITVSGQGGQGGAPAVVTISTVNSTVCSALGGCSSVPANLNNVTGQLDVTVNVDPGNQRLVGVDLLLNCGAGDIVVATQTLASAAQASAEASAAPVTLSFNTAAFTDSTGAVTYKNGACTIKARARTNATAGGAITTTTSTATNIVLNNQDVVYAAITSTKSAINPVTNLVWNGGDVTVRAVPLLYSGRTAGTMTVTFECRTVTRTGTGPQSFTFIDANDAQANPCTAGGTPTNTGAGVALTGPTLQSLSGGTPAANDIDNITDPAATATFTLVDNAGQPIVNPASCGAAGSLCSQASVLVNVNAPTAMATIRLDTQRPAAGSLNLASNALQNTTAGGYIGGNFRFVADSAAGYTGPNGGSAVAAGTTCLGNNGANNTVVCNADLGGVDSVTVQFLSATSRTGTRTAVTSTSGLAESATNATYNLIQITTDRLGNADTSYVVAGGVAQVEFSSTTTIPTTARFGVDRTGPALGITASPTANQTSQVIHPVGSKDYIISVRDTATGTAAPSGPAPQVLLAQVKQLATTGTSTLPASGTIFTNGNENVGANSGCVVGLWNRGTTSGGANALPVYDATGAQIGTCTPTLYSLVVGTTVSANIAGGSEYATTRIIAIDQAGNQSAPFTNAVLEDAVAPGVPVIDAPTSISGGSSVTFAARATDNLDVVGGIVQLNYPTTGMLLQYPTAAGPGAAFDNVLTTTGTITPTVSVFYRNLQVSTAAQPSGQVVANAPDKVNVADIDAAGNTNQTTLQNLSLFTTFTQPTTAGAGQAVGSSNNVYSSNFNGGFTITNATNATLSDCSAAGCASGTAAASPTSTTLTATAAGVTGALANPFTTVQFWYQVGGAGPWYFAGTASNAGVRDTGVGGQRFFDYTLTFTPAKGIIDPLTGLDFTTAGTSTLTFKAIGANSTGDGIITSNAQTITVNNF